MATRPDRIDAETAYEYLEQERATFLDARPNRDWDVATDQIPGALHVDPASGIALDELLRSLPREHLFIAYCDEPDQAASAHVARRVRALGLGDGSILEGGYRAWKDAGMPVEMILGRAQPPPVEPVEPP